LRAIKAARTNLVDLEELPEEELCRLKEEFQSLSHRAPRPAETVKGQAQAGKNP
jgi:hypothetical protein